MTMAGTITQWKTPPVELGAKVRDIAPPTAHLTPPQAIVAAAVVTMATAEVGARVRWVIVHRTVRQLAIQCTTVENTVIAVQMVRLCTRNPKEDRDLSNMTLRQSIIRFFLNNGILLIFCHPCQPP